MYSGKFYIIGSTSLLVNRFIYRNETNWIYLLN